MRHWIAARASTAWVGALGLALALGLTRCATVAGSSSGAGAPGSHVSVTATPAQSKASPAWVSASVPAETASVRFAPSAPQTAYLCAIDGPAVGQLAHSARLYKSVDGAATWSLVPHTPIIHPIATSDGIPTIAMCDVYVDAADARDIFFQQTQFQPAGAGVAIARALYRSRDGGATWTTLHELDRTNGFRAIAVAGSRLIAQFEPSMYGGAPCPPNAPAPKPTSEIVASDDGGQTWQMTGQNVMAARYSPNHLFAAGAALFVTSEQVHAAACQGPNSAALWRSLDGGATWMHVASSPVIESVSFTARAGGAGYYGVAVAGTANAQTPSLLFSSDSGATWAALPALPAPNTLNFPGYYAAMVTPTGDVVTQANFAPTAFILHRSTAAPSWAPFAPAVAPGDSNDPGVWQLQSVAQGVRLWSAEFQYGGQGALDYVSLP